MQSTVERLSQKKPQVERKFEIRKTELLKLRLGESKFNNYLAKIKRV